MIDLLPPTETGLDSGTFDTQVERAKNILSVQLGSLEYAFDLGIDLRFFLSEDFQFQNDAFKSYLIEVLANRGINVSTIAESVENLFNQLTISLTPAEQSTGLVAR